MDRGLTSQGVLDKNESALVAIEIDTKLVSPYIVLSQEYYSRFNPRNDQRLKEVVPQKKKKKNNNTNNQQQHNNTKAAKNSKLRRSVVCGVDF